MTNTAPWQPTKSFWLAYAVAWLPYWTGLMLVFKSERSPYLTSLLQAGRIVAPLAIAGVGLVAIFRKVPWNPRHKQTFFAVQIGLALGFIIVTLVVITLLGSLMTWRAGGAFRFSLTDPFTPLVVFNNLLVFLSICAITYGLQLSVRLQEEASRALQAEMSRNRAELQVLRTQLNPHFLFNTLHSLQALIRIAPERAEDALDQFGALIRYPLRVQNQHDELIPFSEEWTFIQNYIDLEALRLGERLQFQAELDDECLDACIPPLILQPLVENAIRHAIAPRAEGGHISLSARVIGEMLQLEVADNGPGCTQETWQDADGLGLRNTQKWLAARFRDRASFAVATSPGEGFKVTITLPLLFQQDRGNRDA